MNPFSKLLLGILKTSLTNTVQVYIENHTTAQEIFSEARTDYHNMQKAKWEYLKTTLNTEEKDTSVSLASAYNSYINKPSISFDLEEELDSIINKYPILQTFLYDEDNKPIKFNEEKINNLVSDRNFELAIYAVSLCEAYPGLDGDIFDNEGNLLTSLDIDAIDRIINNSTKLDQDKVNEAIRISAQEESNNIQNRIKDIYVNDLSNNYLYQAREEFLYDLGSYLLFGSSTNDPERKRRYLEYVEVFYPEAYYNKGWNSNITNIEDYPEFFSDIFFLLFDNPSDAIYYYKADKDRVLNGNSLPEVEYDTVQWYLLSLLNEGTSQTRAVPSILENFSAWNTLRELNQKKDILSLVIDLTNEPSNNPTADSKDILAKKIKAINAALDHNEKKINASVAEEESARLIYESANADATTINALYESLNTDSYSYTSLQLIDAVKNVWEQLSSLGRIPDNLTMPEIKYMNLNSNEIITDSEAFSEWIKFKIDLADSLYWMNLNAQYSEEETEKAYADASAQRKMLELEQEEREMELASYQETWELKYGEQKNQDSDSKIETIMPSDVQPNITEQKDSEPSDRNVDIHNNDDNLESSEIQKYRNVAPPKKASTTSVLITPSKFVNSSLSRLPKVFSDGPSVIGKSTSSSFINPLLSNPLFSNTPMFGGFGAGISMNGLLNTSFVTAYSGATNNTQKSHTAQITSNNSRPSPNRETPDVRANFIKGIRRYGLGR